MARRVYKGDIPLNVKKAFAERLRQARIKGETNTEEYRHIMDLRSQGAITEQIARTALRKRKVSHETKTPEQKFLDRAEYWKRHGLEFSAAYQNAMKRFDEGRLKDINTALPRIRGIRLKKERLNALLEKNKEYIYEGAMQDDQASDLLFNDIVDTNRDMFSGDNIDKYIKLLEDYENDKRKVLEEYERAMDDTL